MSHELMFDLLNLKLSFDVLSVNKIMKHSEPMYLFAFKTNIK